MIIPSSNSKNEKENVTTTRNKVVAIPSSLNLILVTSSKDKRENVTRIKNGIMPSSLTLILVTIRFGASLRLSLLQLDLGPPLLVSV